MILHSAKRTQLEHISKNLIILYVVTKKSL
jgi:hypothetical protein